MESTVITVRAEPDTLVKIYDETSNEVIYIDNTDDNGETPPIKLPRHGGKYYVDITIYSNDHN